MSDEREIDFTAATKDDATRSTFWGYMCSKLNEFWIMLSMGLMFMILGTVTLIATPSGSASYFVSIQVIGISFVLVAGTGSVIWYCNR